MNHPRRAFCTLSAVLVLLAAVTLAAQRDENKKPNIALKVNPPLGFTPLRVRVEVELRGGADDYQDYYCPSIEWDWADGTVSEKGDDCEPYEAGKSKIQRRYSTTYTFRHPGEYKVYFRMKQKNKVVAASSATVQVRAGAREFDDR